MHGSGPVPPGGDVDDHFAAAGHHGPVDADIVDAGVAVAGDHRARDVGRGVLARGPDRDRDAPQIGVVSGVDDLLAPPGRGGPGRQRTGQRLDPSVVDVVGLDAERDGIGRARRPEDSGRDRRLEPVHMLEQQPEAVGLVESLEHPPRHAGDLPVALDRFRHPPQLAALLEHRDQIPQVAIGHPRPPVTAFRIVARIVRSRRSLLRAVGRVQWRASFDARPAIRDD